MDINIIEFIFFVLALSTGILGLLINVFECHLPLTIIRTYRYGKYGIKDGHSIVKYCEVPKRWFQHFYLFAAPAATCVLYLVVNKYLFTSHVPESIYSFLDLLFGSNRKVLVSAEDTIFAISLLTIQCWKRFYETHFVNVFSDAKINLCHYLSGYIHYVGAITCTIAESEGFVRNTQGTIDLKKLQFIQIFLGLQFLLMSYKQLDANKILAGLRKNKNKISHDYKIPRKDIFNYVSAPLQSTEISMYIILSIILWKSHTFHFVTFWVLVNQFETAFLTHQWYKTTFKDYPKNRCVLIPWIF